MHTTAGNLPCLSGDLGTVRIALIRRVGVELNSISLHVYLPRSSLESTFASNGIGLPPGCRVACRSVSFSKSNSSLRESACQLVVSAGVVAEKCSLGGE